MSVTLHIHETGEIKQVALSGIEVHHGRVEGERTEHPWSQSPLDAVLRFVSDLADAVDRAEIRGRDVVITVKEHTR